MEFNLDYEKGQIDQLIHMKEHVIKPLIDQKVIDLDIKGFITDEPVSFKDISKYEKKPFKIGDTWGQNFLCGWFFLKGQVKNLDEDLYLKLDLNGEACLFDEQGTPIKGFTNGSSTFDKTHGEPGKLYYKINHLIKKNGAVDLIVEGGSNDLFGVLCEEGSFKHASIVTIDSKIKTLYDDLDVLLSLLKVLNRNESVYQSYLEALLEVYVLVTYQEKDYIERALEITKKILSTPTKNPLSIVAVGHAHIDLAWLWPIRETRRKAGRTLANVIDLIMHHDQFLFGISQPQMLEWIRQDYPKLFEKIKYYVSQGRIELQGGMWVEADTNVSGEEALVRQMLYGIDYYQKNFGVRVKNLWLPDVFVYSGAMPQIIKKSGLDYFMTTKISWSLINKFPYHSYHWQGIDGSKVLCHMPPEGTYNSSASPRSIYLTDQNYQEKEIAPHALLVYGIGDGGGGPGYEHLHRIDREKNFNPLPKVSYGDSNLYFKKLETYQKDLPTWQGELYLENHQGTYTSQANVKKYNRHFEQKLRSLEVLLSLSDSWTDDIKKTLDDIWKEVLLYQFHDILPGSSIKRVYDECLERYAILDKETDLLFKKISATYQENKGLETYVFNPLSIPVSVDFKTDEGYITYDIEPFSLSRPKRLHKLEEKKSIEFVQTDNYDIYFDVMYGHIASIKHRKTGKELLKENANRLHVYQDIGDAWNIPDHYRKQTPLEMILMSRQVRSNSKVTEIVQNYVFKSSSLKETIYINQETDFITFSHDVNWQNKGYMLRTSFPLNIKFDEATFDIQFGEIKRSAKNENRITSAQFEVPGQAWVSVSDDTYGFSLINQSKYGYHVKDQVVDLNLLRSTDYPCKDGDIGKTSYRYQVYLHEGNHEIAKVDQFSQSFNAFYPSYQSNIQVGQILKSYDSRLVVSAIKKALKDDAYIVRIYNPMNQSIKTDITFDEKYQKIELTNLVEESMGQADLKDLEFTPFEVKTYKLS